jgi:galactokinase
VITVHAPGRVNLIGDHTDYMGGLVMPMAVDLGTTIEFEPGGDRVQLVSDTEARPADIPLDTADPAAVEPAWARYVAGVVATIKPAHGGTGRVTTTLPVGAGLSSSAALEVALALALGFEGSVEDLARACQEAEQRAVGVPCGIMDQLASAGGVEGHALLLDCRTLAIEPVPLPGGIDVVVAHSGQERALAGSAYAERRAQCEAAEREIGPLRDADPEDVAAITDPTTRARARHVVTENARVRAFADALRAGDLHMAGELMTASHVSLRDDFAVSTDPLNHLVGKLAFTPGVFGARLTGAGFGGCVVALAEAGAPLPVDAWRLRPVAGASLRPA